MNRITNLGIVIGLAALITGCGGGGNGLTNQPNARVQFANLMPGIASAKAKVGEDTIGDNILFETVSDNAITSNSSKDLTVGDTTFDNLATLEDQVYQVEHRYTAVGYGTSPRAILLIDHNKDEATNGTVGIRATHAAQGAPAVDVYLSAVGDSLPASPSFDALAVAATSSFSEVPVTGTNEYRIRIYADGNTTTAIVDKTVTIDPRERWSAIVYTDAGETSGFNVLMVQESI